MIRDQDSLLRWMFRIGRPRFDAVEQLSGHVGYFKLGLEIFTREGPRLVEEIRGRGEKIFLDLKLHDIPNTVRGAVRSACRLGVQMLTVHASGGPDNARGRLPGSADLPNLHRFCWLSRP